MKTYIEIKDNVELPLGKTFEIVIIEKNEKENGDIIYTAEHQEQATFFCGGNDIPSRLPIWQRKL